MGGPDVSVLRSLLVACCVVLPGPGRAATIVHVKYPIYGCEKPDVVTTINNEADPRHTDPNWLAATMGYGQCVRITPQSPWEPISADQGGVTLLAYRGTVGRPGSFFVPTAAIDFATAVGARAGNSVPADGAAPADQPASGNAGPAAAPGDPGTAEQGTTAGAATPPAAPAPADPQLAEVEAGVATIEPAGNASIFPLLGWLALAAAGAGVALLVWRRRGATKRARMLDAIRREVAGNAQALRAKRAQSVQTDEYGTADWSQWHAAKDYYMSTRIDPIVADHGFRRLPARCEGEVDELIEMAATGQPHSERNE